VNGFRQGDRIFHRVVDQHVIMVDHANALGEMKLVESLRRFPGSGFGRDSVRTRNVHPRLT